MIMVVHLKEIFHISLPKATMVGDCFVSVKSQSERSYSLLARQYYHSLTLQTFVQNCIGSNFMTPLQNPTIVRD